MKAKRFRKKINSPVGNTLETSLMTASIKVKVRTERFAKMMPATARSTAGWAGRTAAVGSAATGSGATGSAATGSAATGSAARGSAEWADGVEAAGCIKW